MKPVSVWRLAFLLGLVVSARAASGQPVPDFSLDDVNPNSPRFQAKVSPRDYLQQVSGYYFGSAG